MARRALVLLDGLDTAGSMRFELEKQVRGRIASLSTHHVTTHHVTTHHVTTRGSCLLHGGSPRTGIHTRRCALLCRWRRCSRRRVTSSWRPRGPARARRRTTSSCGRSPTSSRSARPRLHSLHPISRSDLHTQAPLSPPLPALGSVRQAEVSLRPPFLARQERGLVQRLGAEKMGVLRPFLSFLPGCGEAQAQMGSDVRQRITANPFMLTVVATVFEMRGNSSETPNPHSPLIQARAQPADRDVSAPLASFPCTSGADPMPETYESVLQLHVPRSNPATASSRYASCFRCRYRCTTRRPREHLHHTDVVPGTTRRRARSSGRRARRRGCSTRASSTSRPSCSRSSSRPAPRSRR